jgi:adenylate cyclase
MRCGAPSKRSAAWRHAIAALRRIWLTAAYGMRGRIEEAREALAAYLRTGTPTNTIALVRARVISTHPVFMAQRERLCEGLRKAGMPEE